MSLPIYVHHLSDRGLERDHNEDSVAVEELPDGSRLLVVCDGMGGHGGGEIASRIAVDTIVDHLRSRPPDLDRRHALSRTLVAAHHAVLAASRSPGGVPGMGTTAVVAWLYEDRFLPGWVGDSRWYLFRGGRRMDRSRDHTRVQEMVKLGILREDEARHHPDAHILSRAIGGTFSADAGVTPEVWNEPLDLEAGDTILLCSDGLHDLVEDEEMYPLVAGLRYEDAARRFVEVALERGGHDNVTVALAVVGAPTLPPVAPGRPRRDTSPDGIVSESRKTEAPATGALASGEETDRAGGEAAPRPAGPAHGDPARIASTPAAPDPAPAAQPEPGFFRRPAAWIAVGLGAVLGTLLGVVLRAVLRP
jgi:serine/threonine protein phosphatase PrpC